MDPQESLSKTGVDIADEGCRYVIEPGVGRVRDIPERLRPREEMDRLGVENVSDDVLLSILLRSGVRGVNVVELSRGLLRKHGSLTALSACSVSELASEHGMGKVKAQVLKAALELAGRLAEESLPKSFRIRVPGDVARLLSEKARPLETEVFWVLHLDPKNKLKGSPSDVTRGILDASLIHAREVFREAVRAGAAAVILAHNHPSGDPSPSAEDIKITRQLVEAGKVVDIKVLDHIILGKGGGNGDKGFLSLREEGLVKF